MMLELERILRVHWAGIIFALLIGLSVLAPQLIWHTDPRYQGIELMGQDAEEHYIARIQEIYEGNFGLGNTFLPDKDKPYLQPPLGEIIQTLIGRSIGLNAIDMTNFGKFLFPVLIALVVYTLAFTLSGSRIAALLAQGSVLLGHLLMSGIGPWLNLIRNILPVGSYTLYSRPINPEISSLIMFVALLILYRGHFIKKSISVRDSILVGVLTGASAYINPYTYTFIGGVILLTCIWFFIKKDPRASRVLLTGAIGIASLIPFGINYIALHTSPDFAALAARQGLVTDHAPIVSIWLALMLVAVTFAWPKVYASSRPFFLILIGTLVVLTEQQIVTGVVLHPSHFHWYITKPILGIMLGMYTAYLLRRFIAHHYVRGAIAGVILFVLFYTSPLLHPIWYRENPDPPVVAAQAYAPAVHALQRISGSRVVWADPGLSVYIPMYTTHDAPNNPYTIYYLNPQSFFENTLFLDYRLAGETPESILATFTRDRVQVSERLFGLFYRQSQGDLAAIPDTTLTELAEKYTAFYARPYSEILQELSIGIVVAPLKEKALYDKIPALTPLQVAGEYFIYQTK